MIKSRHSEIVLEETDILDWIMQNPKATMPEFLTRGVDIPKQAQDIVDTLPTLKTWSDQYQYTEDFDIQNQQTWYMPEYYQNFDIAKWCLDQCKKLGVSCAAVCGSDQSVADKMPASEAPKNL